MQIINTPNKITVFDSPMSYGKTNTIIKDIKENPNNFYCVFTPLLSEVNRYIDNCPEVNFIQPLAEQGTKTEDLENILENTEYSIVTSHAMFDKLTPKMLKAIRYRPTEGKKVLIMDETLETVRNLSAEIDPTDIEHLLSTGCIVVDQTKRVTWVAPYVEKFKDIKNAADNEQLYLINDLFFVFEVPLSFIESFDKVIILTYMFEASIMYYYFKYYEIPFQYVEVDQQKVDGLIEEFKGLIEVLPELPEYDTRSLSKTDFRDNPERISQVNESIKQVMKGQGNTLENTLFTFFTRFNDTTSDKWLKNKAIGKLEDCSFENGECRNSFLSHTVRATNEYSHKELMIYCIRKYPHVGISGFFSQKGTPMSTDRYALSEMIQWIFRGCVRDRKPMKVCILNPHMRKLFIDWLDGKAQIEDHHLSPEEYRYKHRDYKKWISRNPECSVYSLDDYIQHGGRELKRRLKNT